MAWPLAESEWLVPSGVCQGWGRGLGLVAEWPRRPRKAQDSCVLRGIGCLPGLCSVPMATSLFSVPYLTVSAESKLFTLFLSRGALCPSRTAHLWDISLCPTSRGEVKTKLLEPTVLLIVQACLPTEKPQMHTQSCQCAPRSLQWERHLVGALVKGGRRKTWLCWVVQPWGSSLPYSISPVVPNGHSFQSGNLQTLKARSPSPLT